MLTCISVFVPFGSIIYKLLLINILRDYCCSWWVNEITLLHEKTLLFNEKSLY